MEKRKAEIESTITENKEKDIDNDSVTKKRKRLWDFIAFGSFLVQTSTVVLLMRYSKMKDSNIKYANSAIIASTEFGKIMIGILYCLYDYILNENKSFLSSIKLILNDVFKNKKILCLMCVPSFVYTIQNFLMYKSLGLIESSIYQIVVQLKTFTTACFGICLLSKKYTITQWISFSLLSIGVAIANLSVIQNTKEIDNITKDEGYLPNQTETHYKGLLYVLGSTITSGFAGTFMEMQLKGNKSNIFIKNIQLSLFSIIGCIIYSYINNDLQQIYLYGFFYGFDLIVLIIIVLNIFGGYFVAIVIKRASIMTKTMLSGIATLLIIFESYLFLKDQQISHWEFYCSVILVFCANYLYNKDR